jgi:hypothetical protein
MSEGDTTMLFPSQAQVLAPVAWQIGRMGQAPDVHPGVILDLTTTTIERRLRDGTTQPEVVEAAIIAIQVTAQEANGGHTYLTVPRLNGKPRAIPTEYLWPRRRATSDGESLLIPGLDDILTIEDLQDQLQKDNAEFVAKGGNLAARAEELAAASKKDAKEAMKV